MSNFPDGEAKAHCRVISFVELAGLGANTIFNSSLDGSFGEYLVYHSNLQRKGIPRLLMPMETYNEVVDAGLSYSQPHAGAGIFCNPTLPFRRVMARHNQN